MTRYLSKLCCKKEKRFWRRCWVDLENRPYLWKISSYAPVVVPIKSTDYESILRVADMNTWEHRRIEQSLMIFFKCFKENGPGYVANLFKPRVTPYNLRSNGLNVVQTSYNSRFLHGSYAYMISHIWNQLPSAVKNAPNASSFRRLLTKLNFIGCQCSNCL